MSEPIKDGGPAFPVADLSKTQDLSMSLRDYFAAQVVNRLDGHHTAEGAAKHAYEVADAMLKARKVQG